SASPSARTRPRAGSAGPSPPSTKPRDCRDPGRTYRPGPAADPTHPDRRNPMTTPETAAEIREQLRGMALSLATGSGPIVEPAAFDAALDAYRDAVLAEQPAVSSAVVAPPADQAALRDRIAEALMRWTERGNSPQYAAMRRPETVRANAYSRADAVLAVLPPTDRAAVLREAAALLHQRASSIDALSSSDFGEEARAVGELAEAAETLRRMADETATEPPQPSLRERHRAAWHALTPDQQTARLAELDEPAAGARQDGAPDDVVTELTEAEFHDAAGKALARLGLTYAELEDQARRRDFSSAQARSLWVTIGGAAPAGARQDGEAQ